MTTPPLTSVQAHYGPVNFGDAIAALKVGRRVARAGWNGKGMWLVLIRAGNAMHTCSSAYRTRRTCIGLKTAGGTMQPGWNASTPDLLAEDWEVLSADP